MASQGTESCTLTLGETRGNHTYQYRIRENGTSTWGSWRSLPSNNTIQNLGETTTYDIQLRRQRTFSTCTDWSDPTTTVYCTTLSCTGTTPTAPQAPQTTSGNQKCQVQRSSSDSSSYIYQYSHNDTAWKEGTGASDLTLFSNLTNDTTYSFRARRKASNNNRACWSPVSTATDCTPSDCAPSTPGAPQWSVGAGTCTLTPNASDTTTGFTYQYSRTNSNQGWQTANSTHSKTFTGLHVGTHTFTTRRLHNDNSCLDPSPQSSTATCTVTVGSSPSSYSPSGYSPSSYYVTPPPSYGPSFSCPISSSVMESLSFCDSVYFASNGSVYEYGCRSPGNDQSCNVTTGSDDDGDGDDDAYYPCYGSCSHTFTLCDETPSYRFGFGCHSDNCGCSEGCMGGRAHHHLLDHKCYETCDRPADGDPPVYGCYCPLYSSGPCYKYETEVTVEQNSCSDYVAECGSEIGTCASGNLVSSTVIRCSDDEDNDGYGDELVTTISYSCRVDETFEDRTDCASDDCEPEVTSGLSIVNLPVFLFLKLDNPYYFF